MISFCNNRRYPLFISILSLLFSCSPSGSVPGTAEKNNLADTTILKLADPTIFQHNGNYYLYGTGGGAVNGFLVYQSSDLKNWRGPVGSRNGQALVEKEAFGSTGFWAPQVFHHNNKFFMAYTANESIAIAQSDLPTGPFKQTEIKKIKGAARQIDPYVFFDDDGKRYLYHVQVGEGNRIFVAELNDDLTDIKEETLRHCISAVEAWENTANARYPVAEGPTVLKHKGIYYLFYSANDFRNIDYAVGYATSNNPYGPWKKYTGNPIISRKDVGINGPGHGDFFRDKQGNLQYVLHTHNSNSKVSPRLTAVMKGRFIRDSSGEDKMVINKHSFRFLRLRNRMTN